MSLEKVKQYFDTLGLGQRIHVLDQWLHRLSQDLSFLQGICSAPASVLCSTCGEHGSLYPFVACH